MPLEEAARMLILWWTPWGLQALVSCHHIAVQIFWEGEGDPPSRSLRVPCVSHREGEGDPPSSSLRLPCVSYWEREGDLPSGSLRVTRSSYLSVKHSQNASTSP